MKLSLLLASFISATAAFAPVTTNTGAPATTALHVSERSERSEALPFLPKPANLGGYVGDVGFDPLRISDYFPMDYLREAEIKHGRICMLATLGFVSVDMGLRIYPLPPGLEGLTSATAHNASVQQGGMAHIFLTIAFLEMASWLSVSAMLQGSGRKPGDFGFDPLGYLKDKTDEEKDMVALQELKNGRLAMLAFGGVVTQSILFGKGFPYV